MLQVKSLDSVKILSVNYNALIDNIKNACDKIRVENNQVQKTLLFGSFQNRNYTPDSDIDILVVVAHDNHDFLERRDQFINYFKDIPFDVNIIVYTENEINKMLARESLFLKNILAEACEL